MGKQIIALLLIAALTAGLAACGVRPGEGSQSLPPEPSPASWEEPPAASVPEASESQPGGPSANQEDALVQEIIKTYGGEVVTQKDGIPRLMRKSYSLFDMRYSWTRPQEIPASFYYHWFFSTLLEEDPAYLKEHYTNPVLKERDLDSWFFPQEEYEAKIQTYFEISTDYLRRGEEYDPELKGYWSAGDGACGTGREEIAYTYTRNDPYLTIELELEYPYGTILANHFTLQVLLEEDGGWKYLGCTCQPNEVPQVEVPREQRDLLPLTGEQWALVDRAQELIRVFQVDSSVFPGDDRTGYDFTKVQELDGVTYTLYQGTLYQGWEDFEADMLRVFTPEFFRELNRSGPGPRGTFTEHQGKLYFLDGARGTNLRYLAGEDRFSAVVKEDKVDLIWYAYYTGGEAFTEGAKAASVRACPIHLDLTPEGWRVSEFILPY
ncbi:MAG: hypothetical protein HFF11_06495 [Angelakisella sp.]|jgi:hypothetical protein|nr:hypothetical protein [Angelakisella sp.]